MALETLLIYPPSLAKHQAAVSCIAAVLAHLQFSNQFVCMGALCNFLECDRSNVRWSCIVYKALTNTDLQDCKNSVDGILNTCTSFAHTLRLSGPA